MSNLSWWRRLPSRLRRRWRVWHELAWARQSSRERLVNNRARRILVLCYGNIYRSPFVAALLRQSTVQDIEVRSAGFHPRVGRETPRDFQVIAKDYGIELQAHRSMLVDRAAAEWADVIVVMDRHNWDALDVFGSAVQSKAVWLGAFTGGGSVDIQDPYGLGHAQMQAVAERLYRGARGLEPFLAAAAVK